jgi:hypothetical protein
MMKIGVFLHNSIGHKKRQLWKYQKENSMKLFLIIFFGTKSAHNKVGHR